MFGSLFKARGDVVHVRLDENLRGLVQQVTEELREVLLVDDDEHTRRLYPTAHPDDEVLEQQYREMVRDQLLMQRLDGIDRLQASIDADTLDVELADIWMNTINQARLVLGTQLDVSESDGPIEHDDPDATQKVIYQVLSHILEELTSARMELL